MKTSDLFIQSLEAHGVEYIFGVPGEENLDLLESLKNSTIQLVVTRNEQTAVFMASTYGRLTGHTGVALATLGPGATNMMTGVAYAQLGGMPVLVITGQKPIKRSKQGQFQVIDVVGMMKPITKFSSVIVDGARVPSMVAHAILTAESEKPGAVHLELPEDIAGEQVIGSGPIVFEKVRRPIPDPKAINSIIQKLEESHHPILLLGAGANRKRVSNYLTKFIKKNNIPFFTSQMGKGVVDERLPQYIGTAALTASDHIHEVINKADLIIAIGHDTIEKPTNIIENGSTQIIHINFTPAQFDELYKPSMQIIGDIGNCIRQLYETDLDNSNWVFKEIYQSANKANKTLMDFAKEQYKSPIMMPARLIYEMREVLDEDSIIALDNGLYKVWFARNYPCYKPNTLLLDNALATMGAGYSSAMIAKMLNPNQQVVAVVGDGGVMMNLGDIQTAVSLGLNLTIIILNDNAYGMIKRKQKNHGYQDFGLDLKNPDFVSLANAFGATGYRLETPNEFKGLFEKVISQPGVKIIEIPFCYPDTIK